MRAILIFLLLTSQSCQKKHEVIRYDRKAKLKPQQLEVSKVTPVSWNMGKDGKFEITKGFQVKLEVPKISKTDTEYLMSQFKIDSYLLSIKRVVQGTKIPIGSMTIPFTSMARLKDIYFYIFHYAAAIRKSHTEYICPPYNLSFKSKSFKIKKVKNLKNELDVSSLYEKKANGEILPFKFNNQIFVAGKRVSGDYYFELNFFNSMQRQLKSSTFEYDQIVRVSSESKVSIPGCETYKGDGLLRHEGKEFKWKR
ncbi:hypothetical protein OAT67_05020 [Bacteriovoracaceae bacterium]|nr:hypothetical protein [Bacteriovoracaceae bacterium]